MSELNYKITQLNEEWKVFNDHVVRMNVDYEIKFYVPGWFTIDYIDSDLDCFENLSFKDLKFLESDNYQTKILTYEITVSSIAKCDLERDKFSEKRGVYICETRAEIKVLEKVRKVIKSLYSILESVASSKKFMDDSINERLWKNKCNLERLKDLEEEI